MPVAQGNGSILVDAVQHPKAFSCRNVSKHIVEGRHHLGLILQILLRHWASYQLLYLPSYSPEYNPIEEAFAKIKNLLGKAAARTREALVEAIGAALSAVSAADTGASSSMPDTTPRLTYCETCCEDSLALIRPGRWLWRSQAP